MAGLVIYSVRLNEILSYVVVAMLLMSRSKKKSGLEFGTISFKCIVATAPGLRLEAYEATSGSVLMLFLCVKQRMVAVLPGRSISGQLGMV